MLVALSEQWLSVCDLKTLRKVTVSSNSWIQKMFLLSADNHLFPILVHFLGPFHSTMARSHEFIGRPRVCKNSQTRGCKFFRWPRVCENSQTRGRAFFEKLSAASFRNFWTARWSVDLHSNSKLHFFWSVK